jgi:hypothetical protein
MVKRFGIHPVQYGVVKDHGIYENLQVSIEVHDEAPTIGRVFLNGKEVGTVEFVAKKHYKIKRHNDTTIDGFKDLGKATAAVISDVFK